MNQARQEVNRYSRIAMVHSCLSCTVINRVSVSLPQLSSPILSTSIVVDRVSKSFIAVSLTRPSLSCTFHNIRTMDGRPPSTPAVADQLGQPSGQGPSQLSSRKALDLFTSVRIVFIFIMYLTARCWSAATVHVVDKGCHLSPSTSLWFRSFGIHCTLCSRHRRALCSGIHRTLCSRLRRALCLAFVASVFAHLHPLKTSFFLVPSGCS